jgi:small subunit ribosomal protein S5
MVKENSNPDEAKNAKPENTDVATTEPEKDQVQDAQGADNGKANGNGNDNANVKPESKPETEPASGKNSTETDPAKSTDEKKDDIITKEVVTTEITSEEVLEKEVKVPKPKEVKKFISKKEDGADFWVPKTRLGKMVKDGKIATMQDALATGLRIREPEIVDILLPELDDEVLDVNMVQRMTDSGRRVRFAIMTVVGNQNGYVGLGSSKGKEVGPAIRKAIDNAKLNVIEIRRGCGSWECGCSAPHTLPFTVNGKSGSTEVTFRPAPRGVGLAVGDVAKHILRLSGIKDAWSFTRGETRTTINYAKAVFSALNNTSRLKTTPGKIKELNIHSGAVDIEPEASSTSESTEIQEK